jgi:hypothetical protein
VPAVTDGGLSEPSNVITVTVRACEAPPGVPVGVVALEAARKVTVQWQVPDQPGAAEYVIEAGSRVGLADRGLFVIPANTETLQGVALPGVYAVRIRARNLCGESGPSTTAIVHVP